MPKDDTAGDDVTDPASAPTAEHREERARLLPEERQVGSDDPEQQAEVILAESAERTADPEGTRDASPQSPERS